MDKNYRGGPRRGSGFCTPKSKSFHDKPRGGRPPSGLKGREIGLWYAQRSKHKKKMMEKSNCGMVHMNHSQLDMAHDALQASHSSCQELAEEHDSDMKDATSSTASTRDYESFIPLKEDPDSVDHKQSINDNIKCLEFNRKLVQEALKEKSASYYQILEFRKKLPAFAMKKEILDAITSHQVLVVTGETGCGKTTQIPQFILDDAIESGLGSCCKIVCTQPRRISAISVAERVAKERDECCGENKSCGYQIRLQSRLPRAKASILYCTTGILIQWLQSDHFLSNISHVILDEIHERNLQSDFLIAIIRSIIKKRNDLKVILMSATLNADVFSQYFGNCPKIHIPGFTFHVTEYYLEDVVKMLSYQPSKRAFDTFHGLKSKRYWKTKFSATLEARESYHLRLQDYEKELRRVHSVETSRNICCMDAYLQKNLDYDLVIETIKSIILHPSVENTAGGILIFVPGWEDIKSLNNLLAKNKFFHSDRYLIIPLHSMMPTVNQQQVFDRPPHGVTKVIIATNIAETSITIDDILYVIDCGKIKLRKFEHGKNICTLQADWITKANAQQRKGRAGRVQEGFCFHLFTKLQARSMDDYIIPEILRTPLDQLSLQIKLLNLGGVKDFLSDTLETPEEESVDLSIKKLKQLNAFDEQENLTALGRHLAKLPVEPQIGKMLLFGAIFSCLDPILTIAASLSFKDPFVIPLGKEKEADKQRKILAQHSNSDHIMFVNVYNGWKDAAAHGRSTEKDYCWDNFLSLSVLKMIKDMRVQFAEYLHQSGFISLADPAMPEANRNSFDKKLITAVVCSGLYPNIAKMLKWKPHIKPKLNTLTERKVSFHPKSVNCDKPSCEFSNNWLCYYEKMKTADVYIYDSSEISCFPLLFFGGDICTFVDDDKTDMISVDGWIKFKAQPKIANTVRDLRQELDKILERKIKDPQSAFQTGELSVINAISHLISRE
ncbi:unnamed protein product [Clavelina lepadiformis]|uniref:RNA helicase n=1 Tax=Clavelina lepadiformis TaxID=159417 RepID=A0ABP0GYU6_CLALP